jgi:hypothetical protein
LLDAIFASYRESHRFDALASKGQIKLTVIQTMENGKAAPVSGTMLNLSTRRSPPGPPIRQADFLCRLTTCTQPLPNWNVHTEGEDFGIEQEIYRMKTLFTTASIVVALAAPAFAQGGNIHGTESRGEPVNSSYRASGVNPATGHTPRYTAGTRANAYAKKKRHHHTTTTGSAGMKSGY